MLGKYRKQSKTKENITKYVFRRVFKSIKEEIQGRYNSRQMPKYFIDTYFSHLRKTTSASDSQIYESLIPFNSNSKNKSMNINFLSDMFSSEKFTQRYLEVISELQEMMEKENEEK